MTAFEITTLGFSGLALIMSGISLYRSGRTHRLATQIQEHELEEIRARKEFEKSAYIDVELDKENERLVFTNTGGAPALNVTFHVDPRNGASPILPDEFARKVPIDVLNPGKSVDFVTALCNESALKFEVTICWNNPDGQPIEVKEMVSF